MDLRVRDGGDSRLATATLTNTGADHYVPTGTPDRHLTLEFTLLGPDGSVLEYERQTLKRTIMWRPFIVDLWDTRLPAGESRMYEFEFRTDVSPAPAALSVVVRYHLLDEARRERIGYDNREPISHVVHEQQIPIS